MPNYESPEIADYGTLLELTEQSNQDNADVQGGPDGTAFSA